MCSVGKEFKEQLSLADPFYVSKFERHVQARFPISITSDEQKITVADWLLTYGTSWTSKRNSEILGKTVNVVKDQLIHYQGKTFIHPSVEYLIEKRIDPYALELSSICEKSLLNSGKIKHIENVLENSHTLFEQCMHHSKQLSDCMYILQNVYDTDALVLAKIICPNTLGLF